MAKLKAKRTSADIKSLKAVMRKHRISQRQIARETGIDHTRICRFLKGAALNDIAVEATIIATANRIAERNTEKVRQIMNEN